MSDLFFFIFLIHERSPGPAFRFNTFAAETCSSGGKAAVRLVNRLRDVAAEGGRIPNCALLGRQGCNGYRVLRGGRAHSQLRSCKGAIDIVCCAEGGRIPNCALARVQSILCAGRCSRCRGQCARTGAMLRCTAGVGGASRVSRACVMMRLPQSRC